MKIIATADYHLSLKETHGTMLPSGITSRLQDKLSLIAESVKYAIDNKADLFISAGDEFDSLNPPELLRYKFIEVMAPLFEAKIPWRLIMGNHTYNREYYNMMSEEKLLTLIGRSDFQIISEPMIEEFSGLPLTYLPWTYIDEAGKFLKANPNRIVFGHLPIEGAFLNDYEFSIKGGLTKDITNTQVFLFMGHYHKYQTSDNWAYIGSIAKQDFSERNQTKGFLEIDIDDHDLNFKQVPVIDRPFTQFEFVEPQDPLLLIEASKFNGDIVKIKLKGTNNWVYSINKVEISTKIEKAGALKAMPPDIEIVEASMNKLVFKERSNFADNIKDYCKEQNRMDAEMLMQEILTDVINTERTI